MIHRRTLAAVAVMLALIVTGLVPPADNAGAGTGGDDETLILSDLPDLTRMREPTPPGFSRFEHRLAVLADRTTRGPLADRMAAAAEAVDVMIGAHAGRGRSVEARLGALGVADAVRVGDTVHATVTGGVLASIASDPNIHWVQSALEPVSLAIEGQGVGYIGADDWHAVGLTGAGVKVAIIDLGFVGYESMLGTELPESVTLIDECDTPLGANKGPTTRVHGTAVAEIVHEVAPDAELYLMCIDNGNDLVQAVNHAVAQGVHVVNHSVGWFNAGRGDGSGPIGDIVDTALAADIVWVNSAGNHAQRHWGGGFTDVDGDGFLEFVASGGSDPTSITANEANNIVVGGNETIHVYLRWDDWPVRSVGLILEIRELIGNTLFLVGEYELHPTAPLDVGVYTNPSATPKTNIYVLVRHVTGAPPDGVELDLFTISGPIQHNVTARSVVDPATKPAVVAVGAVCWSNGNIRSYSSRGPNIDGIVRPDLAGPDGVSNATYGNTQTPSNCNGGFTGTSAAAPHVAGAAALVRQLYTVATQADLHDLLTDLTVDAGSGGLDNAYGHGILALGDPPGFIDGTVTSSSTTEPLEGIEVAAFGADQVLITQTTTNGNGEYLMPVGAGDYRLRFSDHSGEYPTQWWDEVDSFSGAAIVSVSTGVATTVDAALLPGGRVSGTVTDRVNGKALSGVHVTVHDPSNQVVSQAVTNSDGAYLTDPVFPGTVKVRFHSPGKTHVDRWWDDKATFGAANPVTVVDAAKATGIDAALRRAPPTVGLVDPTQGQWYLRNSAGQVTSFFFGNPGDIPFMGDWNCNGIRTPGLYRQSDGFVYLRNSNSQGIANITFFFGNPGDVPIVGDFNGNGCETVSIYRPSNQTFYIINALGQDGGGLGAATTSYVFGNPGDKPFTGDFNGNGITTVGLHRESTGFVYFRNTHTQGNADNQFFFGNPGDRFVTGDWNGNGIDSPGIFRPANTTFYFRFTNTQGNADAQFTWGQSGWLPVAGRFGLG